MRTFTKRLILTAAAVLCCTLTTWAQTTFASGNLTYTVTNAINKYVSVAKGSKEPTGALTIPSSVTYNNTTYTVTEIGSKAFYKCSGLTEITIPNSVTSIGSLAFEGCSGLTSITIPNSVKTIGNYAFYDCSGLTSITIPNSVTSIGSYAFAHCSRLTKITIGNSVTSIGDYAFEDCTSLKSVTIPESVTSIGLCAFYVCSGLTSVTIPNSVTSIGEWAFRDCSGLTSVTIPNSVTSIGSSAFYSCYRLKSVIFERETPPSFGTSVFYNTNNCPIYVPTVDAVTAYKAADNMSSYANRVIYPICTITVKANNADYGTVSGGGTFDMRTTTTTKISATAKTNYQFVSWNDGNPNNPRTITISGTATYTAIFKRVLTVSNIVAANKVYDGTKAATLTFATDKRAGDDVTVGYTATFDNANAGTGKTVTYSFTLSGADANNYILANAAGTAKANITAKPVSNPTITLSATSFIYNGSAQKPTVTSVKDGTTVIPASEYSVAYSADVTNAGSKTVTISNVSGNYTVSGSATYVINPKAVSSPTITLNATSFTYNGSAQKPTVTSVKDGTTVIPEYSVAYSADVTNAGSKTVTISNVSGNYTVSGSASYVINPKVVTAKAVADSREYDGTNSASGSVLPEGIVSGDQVFAIYLAPAFANKNVETGKTVTFSGISLGGNDKDNYTLNSTTATATATITARELTLSNFTANNKVYDGTETATLTFETDKLASDDVTVDYTAAFDNANAGTDKTVTYNFTLSGADADNYVLANATGTATANITPFDDEVIITITPPTKMVRYNGTEQTYEAEIGLETVSVNNYLYPIDGFAPADPDNFKSSISGTNVGLYELGWNNETFVNINPNFSNVKFNVTDGSLSIDPTFSYVLVTITGNSSKLVYNAEEQKVEGYTVSIDDLFGVYSEEDFSFTGDAVAVGTDVGVYPMELSRYNFTNLNQNYYEVEFVVVDGALTIYEPQNIESQVNIITDYKLGQDLNLDGAKLYVDLGDGEQEVDLTAGMISGFDPNKEGEQEVVATFTIDDIVYTTTFKVNVHATLPISTPIASVETETELRAFANGNTIVIVSNATAETPVSIFDINGRLVAQTQASGARTEITVQQQGVYIIKSGNSTSKVIVF